MRDAGRCGPGVRRGRRNHDHVHRDDVTKCHSLASSFHEPAPAVTLDGRPIEVQNPEIDLPQPKRAERVVEHEPCDFLAETLTSVLGSKQPDCVASAE